MKLSKMSIFYLEFAILNYEVRNKRNTEQVSNRFR